MLYPHSVAAILLLLVIFKQFNPAVLTPSKQHVSLIRKTLCTNVEHFFAGTKNTRDAEVLGMRENLLQIALHNHGMKDTTNTELPNAAIAKHFSMSRSVVSKHRNNKGPYKKTQPPKKKTGTSKSSFVFKHNKLVQTVVKFWLDHSTPSPNKKDVKWNHSRKQGNHVRVYNADHTGYKIQCTTSKCMKDQRRCVVLVLYI